MMISHWWWLFTRSVSQCRQNPVTPANEYSFIMYSIYKSFDVVAIIYICVVFKSTYERISVLSKAMVGFYHDYFKLLQLLRTICYLLTPFDTMKWLEISWAFVFIALDVWNALWFQKYEWLFKMFVWYLFCLCLKIDINWRIYTQRIFFQPVGRPLVYQLISWINHLFNSHVLQDFIVKLCI